MIKIAAQYILKLYTGSGNAFKAKMIKLDAPKVRC